MNQNEINPSELKKLAGQIKVQKKMDPPLKSDESPEEIQPSTIEEFMEQLEKKIVSSKYFKSGKVDEYGHVVGVKEYPPGRVPHVHQVHYYDSLNRVIKLEKFEKEFSKPTVRVYFYEKDGDKIMESVWFDRYGKLDNIHRYQYDSVTGLMQMRAEYNREGEIYYAIVSGYDDAQPPHLIEEKWQDKAGNMLKRFCYHYDESREMIMEEQFDNRNILIGYSKFTYDTRGNLKTKEWYNPRGQLMSTFTHECDENDLDRRVTLTDGKGNIEGIQEFLYDQIGNLIEEKWLDKEGKVFKTVKY